MGMTEKQGGSDLRSNTSRAERISDGLYRISGHKWFLSAPMSDAFVMIAQMDEGPVVSWCRGFWRMARPTGWSFKG